MIRNALVLGTFIIAGFALAYWLDHSAPAPAASTEQKQNIGLLQQVPAFTFETLDGKTHDIRELKGQKILLHFWATWCAPCVVEFPDIVTRAAKDNLVLIAISSDLSDETIEKFLEKQTPDIRKKLESKNILMARDRRGKITADLFQTYKLPETLLIDKDQTMRRKIVGGTDWKKEDL